MRLRRAAVLAGVIWLAAGVCLPARASRTARITAYTEWGITYSGEPTIPGRTAACSWNIPLWSTITLPDGEQRVCTDRGALGYGNPDWIDIFAPGGWQWVPETYGDYAEIEVD